MSIFEQSLAVVRRNIDAYKLMHVHVTYSEALPKGMRQTQLITPFGSQPEKVHISSEKVTSVVQFLRVVKQLDEKKVLGIKVEGVFPTKPIRDFCYYELHKKGALDDFNSSWMLVYSVPSQTVIGTQRYYDIGADVEAKEVCIYEHWFEDMEAEWKRTPWEQQHKTLKLYLLRQ